MHKIEKEQICNYDKYIHSVWLNYFDKVIENEYIKNRQVKSKFTIQGLLLLFMFFVLDYLIINILVRWTTSIIFRSIQLAVLIIFYKKILNQYQIQQMLIFFLIISNELFILFDTIPSSIEAYQQNSKQAILIGILISMQIIVPLMLLDLWYLISLCIMALYIITNLTLDLYIQTLIGGWLLLIFIIVIVYFMEKQKKKTFLEFYLQQMELAGWKMLLDEYIPLAVFMVSKSSEGQYKYSFINKWCSNLISQSQSQNIVELVNNIQINNQLDSSIYQQQEPSYQKNKILKTNTLPLIQKIEQYDFLQHETYLNSSIPNSSTCKDILCDIQIVACGWQEDQSAIIIINQISKIVKKNRQKELNAYKQNVLATITRDLKTPLNGVVSILDALEGCNDIELIHTYTQLVKYNVQLLYLTINNILDECQMIKGKIDLRVKQFDLLELMQQLNDLTQHICQEKQIDFIIDCKLESTLIANDEQRLRQLIYIMINNSIKYTQKGSIKARIDYFENLGFDFKQMIQQQTTEYQFQQLLALQQHLIVISIQDTGIGMNDFVKSKLFKFFGLMKNQNNKEANISQKQHGSGLGLVIAQNLVGFLGPINKIIVESEENKGSTFTVFIYHQIEKNKNQGSNSSYWSSTFKKNNRIKKNSNNDMANQLKDKICDPVIDVDQYAENLVEENVQEEKHRIQFDLLYACKHIKAPEDKLLIIKNKNLTKTQIDITLLRMLYIEKTRMLIVDDTSFNIIGLKLLLQYNSNIIVDTACNGQQAIDLIIQSSQQQLKYSIVFMDINMPIMDGFEATVKLNKMMLSKQIYPFTIIITTTIDQLSDRRQFYEIGAVELIPKPITLHQLVKCLSHIK